MIADLAGKRIVDVAVEAERDNFTLADTVTLRLDDGSSVIFYGACLNTGFGEVGWEIRPQLDLALPTT
jgi:hypothetical protein